MVSASKVIAICVNRSENRKRLYFGCSDKMDSETAVLTFKLKGSSAPARDRSRRRFLVQGNRCLPSRHFLQTLVYSFWTSPTWLNLLRQHKDLRVRRGSGFWAGREDSTWTSGTHVEPQGYCPLLSSIEIPLIIGPPKEVRLGRTEMSKKELGRVEAQRDQRDLDS